MADPDYSSMSYEELKALVVSQQQKRKDGTLPAAPPTPVDQLPESRDWPDMAAIRTRLRTAALNASQQQFGTTDKAQEMYQRLTSGYEPPAPIPEKPTLPEQVRLAVSGTVRRTDNRPLSSDELTRAQAAQAIGALAAPVTVPVRGVRNLMGLDNGEDPAVKYGLQAMEATGLVSEGPPVQFGTAVEAAASPGSIPENLARFASQAPSRGQPTAEEEGLIVEPGTVAAMRAIGTAASAAVIEMTERIPLLDTKQTGKNLAEARSLEDVVHALDMSSVGEWVGAAPGHNQRVRRSFIEMVPTPLGYSLPVVGADAIQGMLERIERGDGFEVDGAAMAAANLGPEYADAGWYLGFGIDALANWEGMLGAGFKSAAGLAKRAKLAGDIPNVSAIERAALALRDSHTDLADTVGREVVRGVENGTLKPTDLPPHLQSYLNEAAAYRGVTPKEQFAADGLIDAAQVEGDAAFLARTQEARDATEGQLARLSNAAGDVADAARTGEQQTRTALQSAEAQQGALNRAYNQARNAKRAEYDAASDAYATASAQRASNLEQLNRVSAELQTAQADLARGEAMMAAQSSLNESSNAMIRISGQYSKADADFGVAEAAYYEALRSMSTLVNAPRKAKFEAKVIVQAADFEQSVKRLPRGVQNSERGRQLIEAGKLGTMTKEDAAAKLNQLALDYRTSGGSSAHRLQSPTELRATMAAMVAGHMDPDVFRNKVMQQAGGMPYEEMQALLKASNQVAEAKRVFDLRKYVRDQLKAQGDAARAAVAEATAASKPFKGAPEVDVEPLRERVASLQANHETLVTALADNQVPEPPPRWDSGHWNVDSELSGQLAQASRRVDELRAEASTARRSTEMAALRAERSSSAAGAAADTHRVALGELASIDEAAKPGDVYVVRTKSGDVAPGGVVTSLDEAVQLVTGQRRLEGDEIWRGSDRAIAMWHTLGGTKSRLVPLSDLAEGESILLRKAADRVGEVELRKFGSPMSREAGDFLASATGPWGKKYVAQTESGRMLQDAYRLYARDTLGASDLKVLPGGAMVTARDRTHILGTVNRELDEAFGVAGKDMADLLAGRVEMTPERLAKVEVLAQKWGYDGVITGIDAPTYNALLHAGVRNVGGILADVRRNVKGTKGLVDSVQEWMAGLMRDRTKTTKLGQAIRDNKWLRSSVGGAIDAVFQDRFVKVPKHVKETWQRLRIQLERDPHQLLKQVESVVKDYRLEHGLPFWRPTDMAPVFAQLLPDYRPLRVDELNMAAEIRTVVGAGHATATDIDTMFEQTMKLAGGDRAPEWMRLAESEHGKRYVMMRWGQERDLTAQLSAREYLLSQVAAGSGAISDTAKQHIRDLSADRLMKVYQELWVDGMHHGPEATAILKSVMRELPDPGFGMGMFLVMLRRDRLIANAVDELVAAGGAMPVAAYKAMQVDELSNVVHDMLMDRHRVWDPARKRYVMRYSEGALQYASRALLDMGVEPGAIGAMGADAALKKVSVGGRELYVPAEMVSMVDDLAGSGALQDVSASVLDEALRIWKMQALAGIGIPQPRYFVAQALSLFPTVYTELGARAVAGAAVNAASTVANKAADLGTSAAKRAGLAGVETMAPKLGDGGVVGELVRRLNSDSALMKNRDPNSWLIRTATGEWLTINQLETEARQWGLEDTVYDYEVGRQFRDVVMAEDSPLRALKAPPAWWQQQIKEYAGVSDQAMRISIFVDQRKAGASAADAANTARRAVLDFRDLTDFDKKVGRRVFTFYAFLRKNQDQFWRVLLRDPGRLTRQMRIADASLKRGRSPEEVGLLRTRDLGRVRVPGLSSSDMVFDASGMDRPEYRGIDWVTSPMGVSEQMFGMATFADPDSWNPLLRTLIMVGSQAVPGDKPNGVYANTVPPVVYDVMRSTPMFQAFAIGPYPIPDGEDRLNADPEASAILHRPAVWMAGGAALEDPDRMKQAQLAYQAWVAWMGPTQNLSENLSQASGFYPPDAPLTQEDELFQYLSGLKATAAPTAMEATRRQLVRQARDMDAATRAMAVVPE